MPNEYALNDVLDSKPFERSIEEAVEKMEWMNDILAMVRWRNRLENQLLRNDILD